MPKTKISEYSATANSNTDVASINIDEGCAPSGINNAIRAVMGHLKDFQQGTNGDPFNGPHNGTVGATTPSTGAFTTLTTTGTINLLTVGRGAGAVSTNTAVGSSALAANTSGGFNTAVGYQAGSSNTTGGAAITAFGYQAGKANTTGYVSAFGFVALAANTSGANNAAFGAVTLAGNTTGSFNTGIGDNALASNTTASNNTAVGYQAGYTNSTGARVTALGYQAGYTNNASDNLYIGSFCGFTNSSGIQNTLIGPSAGYYVTGSYNTAVGALAMGYGNVGASGSSNTAIGDSALKNITSGGTNTVVGQNAGPAVTSGSENVLVGVNAGQKLQTGAGNTIIGRNAGIELVSGSSNVIIGLRTGVGGAGQNVTGSANTFVGPGAGSYVTSGQNNTLIGGYDGLAAPVSQTNSGIVALSDGSGNVRFYADGSGNLFAGASNCSFSINSTGGYSRFGSISATNVLQVSYNSTSSGVSLTSAATSWGTFSDQRLKNVTGVYENALSDIAQIEPIKFTWKSDESNKPCVGVLAHTVKAVVPEAVEEVANSMEDETLYLQVRYTELIPLMIASIKELKAEVDSLKAQINGASA